MARMQVAPSARNRVRAARIVRSMRKRSLVLILPALLAGCVAPEAARVDDTRRPLDTLPGNARLGEVEADLLATARARFGAAALERTLAAPTHLIVKRFAGMAPPPPPPGAGADWRPPTPSAMMIKDSGRWLVATPDGWRDANGAAAAEIEAVMALREFWDEPATSLACPDYGASLLLLRAPARARTVRNSMCTSVADRIVLAALRA